MPARMEFEFALRPQGKAADTASGPGRVRRLLLLGNFCGQACADRPPLAQRRAQRVDLDNLDSVMASLVFNVLDISAGLVLIGVFLAMCLALSHATHGQDSFLYELGTNKNNRTIRLRLSGPQQ